MHISIGLKNMKKIKNEKVIKKARNYFLRETNQYGCAETSYITLKEIYCLQNQKNSSAAMALNGGIAYSGGVCGAITGGAMAIGELSKQRIKKHKKAKTIARKITMKIMEEFKQEFGSCNCSDLIKYDISIPEEHDKFIESGVWKEDCMAQIEFVVSKLFKLHDKDQWNASLKEALD